MITNNLTENYKKKSQREKNNISIALTHNLNKIIEGIIENSEYVDFSNFARSAINDLMADLDLFYSKTGPFEIDQGKRKLKVRSVSGLNCKENKVTMSLIQKLNYYADQPILSNSRGELVRLALFLKVIRSFVDIERTRSIKEVIETVTPLNDRIIQFLNVYFCDLGPDKYFTVKNVVTEFVEQTNLFTSENNLRLSLTGQVSKYVRYLRKEGLVKRHNKKTYITQKKILVSKDVIKKNV